MDRPPFLTLDLSPVVNGFTDDVHDPSQCSFADGNGNRLPQILDLHPADQAVGPVHGNTANGTLAQVLLHLQGDIDLPRFNLQGVHEGGDLPHLKLGIHNGAEYLCDLSFVHEIGSPFPNIPDRSWIL